MNSSIFTWKETIAMGIICVAVVWLGRTLDDVEQLEQILIQGNDTNINHNKIGEAA